MIDLSPGPINIFLILLLFFIGIPHGAGDIVVMHKRWGIKKLLPLSIIYFFFFLSGMILWKINGSVFFTILWPISFLHFLDVENQLTKKGKMNLSDVMFYSLFSLPLIKSDEFISYMKSLDGMSFYSIFVSLYIPIIVIQIYFCVKSLKENFRKEVISHHVMTYALIGVITHYLNLVQAFIFIFIFIHSIRHLHLSFINNFINIKKYSFILLPTSLVAMFIIYSIKNHFNGSENQLIFLSIGLGSLAIPHFILDKIVGLNKN
tara:strand:- start:947 stop:1732 length:786 start_codon:yes stop_codon:yes gene_type:complete